MKNIKVILLVLILKKKKANKSLNVIKKNFKWQILMADPDLRDRFLNALNGKNCG